MTHHRRDVPGGLGLSLGLRVGGPLLGGGGGLPTPDVVWNFESGVLPGTSTLTRADEKWYRNDIGVWVSAGINVPRFHNLTPGGGQKGLLLEGPKTKLAIQRRDFTDVAWVKTNITPAKDAVGIDGVANSCSTLTSTAANATVLQAVTSPAQDHNMSFFVARKTGTGTIEATIDNGISWTDIASSLTSDIDNPFHIIRTNIANPSIGFRIVTSGDAIIVDCVDVETTQRFSTPFVQDNTAAESTGADDITDTTSLSGEYSMMFDGTASNELSGSAFQGTMIHFPPSGINSLFFNTLVTARLLNGNDVSVTASTTYEGERHKFAFSQQQDRGLLVDDEGNSGETLTGTPSTCTLRFGSRNASSKWWDQVIHRVEAYTTLALTLEQLQARVASAATLLSLGYGADILGYGSDVMGYIA